MTANGYKVSLGSDENVLKLDCVDGYTTLWVYQGHLILHFKWVKFMVFKLYTNKADKNNIIELYLRNAQIFLN